MTVHSHSGGEGVSTESERERGVQSRYIVEWNLYASHLPLEASQHGAVASFQRSVLLRISKLGGVRRLLTTLSD